MKLLFMQLSPTSYHFIPLRSCRRLLSNILHTVISFKFVFYVRNSVISLQYMLRRILPKDRCLVSINKKGTWTTRDWVTLPVKGKWKRRFWTSIFPNGNEKRDVFSANCMMILLLNVLSSGRNSKYTTSCDNGILIDYLNVCDKEHKHYLYYYFLVCGGYKAFVINSVENKRDNCE
jgi:hypothetical protein